jgi:hypothetical protein
MTGVQKSLFGFLKDKDKEEMEKTGEKLKSDVEEKKVETRKSNQIETDYYEKSRIDVCANILRKMFNVNIEIIPVRYGSKSEKIYGYYMLIKIKSGDKDRIVEFIRKECGLKVF